MSGLTLKASASIATVLLAGLSLQSVALAQTPAVSGGRIADKDGIFIDGKNFTVTPGLAKNDIAARINTLGARDLGSGAIIFRSGAKLYIVSGPLPLPMGYDQAGGEAYATGAQVDQPNRVKIQYDATKNPDLQAVYDRLKDRRFLERVAWILSPLRLPEELTIKTAECGVKNSWYMRNNSQPTITLCYELLNTISQSGPKSTDPNTPTDQVIGQAVWLALHEVGHAVFDIFHVPLFGHTEDAADNFATYVMLQMGEHQAKRLILGASWAWKDYVADYRTNPVIHEQLVGFASNHGQPQERFYNLMCLAYGADPVTFADLTRDGFLPPNRAPDCQYDYKVLVDAFDQEIMPHVDGQMKREIMDTSWLPPLHSIPTAQN
jgi:Putative metallopeptidase